MSRIAAVSLLLVCGVALSVAEPAPSACCYFAAKDKDILQPAQKAFLTWDPDEKIETFTVQPKFEGNAVDFGMVIPTPTQPKLHEMPRDFFKELAVFTILEPMDLKKYKRFPRMRMAGMRARGTDSGEGGGRVRVLESGVVGSLDYKIIQADKADDLYAWLKDNHYSYSGDQATLDFYIKKGWFFTVMKIDPAQMRKNANGSYQGEVTPTRFQFSSNKLIYPLKITQISVKDHTEALFYVQAAQKMDLPETLSYEVTWQPMWSQATSFAIPEKLTNQEKTWQEYVRSKLAGLQQRAEEEWRNRRTPATLEWAKKLTADDIAVLDGAKKYNREAPPEDIKGLRILKGHIRQGQYLSKIRKVFTKPEMESDLEFIRARVGDRDDDMEYFAILPTSPP
jgi:hypothetical protein